MQYSNVGSNLQMNQHRRQQDHKENQRSIVTKILSCQIGILHAATSGASQQQQKHAALEIRGFHF